MYERFIFEKYKFIPQEKTLLLSYSLDKKISFQEKITFDFDFGNYNTEALDKAFFGVFVMCGISYFKAYIPQKIKFKTGGLTENQKRFFEKIYTYGLGEFFYRNEIDPNGKINFVTQEGLTNEGININNLTGSLVPIGGGKDSITTAEILKKNNEDFETWTVGNYPFFAPMIEKIGKNHLQVQRAIDSQLFTLNDEGALNGHVPISAILAFLGVASAILRGKKNVILSNENSANEPTLEFNGTPINHQYSKSLEFEADFQNYVHENISPDVNYFSFLRPLSELKIAEMFCKNFLEKYEKDFSSCNTNFRITDGVSQWRWCQKCPKCAFVFILFAPFVEREKLIEIFGGNLFANKELYSTFAELLGQTESKPFECVGEIEEVKRAFQLAKETGNWPELEDFSAETTEYNEHFWNQNLMPSHFENILKAFTQ
jgi:UDP-N-acetyl-alpha-D-muramoyl-L-alanyl-L-glutamate epimerase